MIPLSESDMEQLRDLRKEFALAKESISLAEQTLRAAEDAGPGNQNQLILLRRATGMVFAKAIDTFQAMVHLCETSWTIEALALLRMLLDCFASGAFIRARPSVGTYMFWESTDRAIDTWLKHIAVEQYGDTSEDKVALRDARSLSKRQRESTEQILRTVYGEPPIDSEAWRKERCKKEGKVVRRYWHELRAEDKLRTVGMGWWYNTIYRIGSGAIHTDAGMQRYYFGEPRGPMFIAGPKPAFAGPVLQYGAKLLLFHAQVVNDVFQLSQKSKIDPLIQRADELIDAS